MWFYGDWLVKNVKRSQFLVYYLFVACGCVFLIKIELIFEKDDDDVICV